MRDEQSADVAAARQELQRAARERPPRSAADGLAGDERRLLGGFRRDAIAGGQRRGDLADENRQRKVPRGDADKDAAAERRSAVLLAGRARQDRLAAYFSRLPRVIAAKIGRFANFRQRVVQRLAGLALAAARSAARVAPRSDRRRARYGRARSTLVGAPYAKAARARRHRRGRTQRRPTR